MDTVENGAWGAIIGTWRQLAGNFREDGCSIEWHDFRIDRPLEWSRSYHARSLEICLNFSGQARMGRGMKGRVVGPGTAAIYVTGDEAIPSERLDRHFHRFLTFELSPEFLGEELRDVLDGLESGVAAFLNHPSKRGELLGVRELPPHLLSLRSQMLSPPVNPTAHSIWVKSKTTEVLASFLFRREAPGELFCKRHQRINRERCERVLYILERDMENPPSLEMMAQDVGCSPFHLSRMFAQETGMSIPKALRNLRIERAASLLLDGGLSVTDVAVRVGYSSLGAFNKAFIDAHGCPPGSFKKTAAP